MDEHKKHFHKPAVPGSSEDTKKEHGGQFSLNQWLKWIEALKTLPVLAGLCQILLGMAVMVIAALGFIRSFWLSVSLGLFGGVTTVMSLYFCYSAIIEYTDDTLLRDAMRRISENQN